MNMTSNTHRKRVPSFSSLLCAVAVMALATLATHSAQATVVLPYASDSDTFLLYHLNDAAQTGTGNAIVDSGPNGVNLRQASGGANNSPFRGVTSPVVFSTPESGASTSGTFTPPANGGGALYRQNYTAAPGFAGLATNDPLPMSNSTFTIEAWVKPLALNPGTSRPFFSIRQNNNRSLQLALNASNQLELGGVFRETQAGALKTRTFATSDAITFAADTWYHLAVTYDYSGGATPAAVQFYLDPETNVTNDPTRAGTPLTTTINYASYGINQFVKTGGDDFNFGTGSGVNPYLDADMDEFRWSNVVRSEFNLAYVPEPGSLTLLMLGLAGVGRFCRRKG